MSWKPKSSRMLVSIGQKNIVAARRKILRALIVVKEMEEVSVRLRRKPLQLNQ